MLRDALHKVTAGQDLKAEEARLSLEEIMSGDSSPALIAAYLTALRMKGESAEEILGSAMVMREKSLKVKHHQPVLFDNCGTGGDGSGTFNISTTSAFVLAGAGLPVGKHGNRSVSSQCGSADLLEALGAKLDPSPQQVGECIDEIGFGFMFAPQLHPAMKEVVPIRRELAMRTIFNILGPLTNPASATHQLIGIFDRAYMTKLAEAAAQLGPQRVGIAHSDSGTDEITTATGNRLVIADSDGLREIRVEPTDFGFDNCSIKDLAGGDAEQNGKITTSILSGVKGPGRDTILLNSAVGLFIAGKTEDIADSVSMAADSIDSGSAFDKMKRYVEFTNR